ncbi:MAG: hypothetical protein OXK80_01955 [Bdellovibrionales bacterium]|nr:hypothetical protein [Bdellovibrionales bacterium]
MVLGVEKQQNIENLVMKACAENNCRLYHMEWHNHCLKVYVDKDQKNIQLSECEQISKRIQIFLMAVGLSRQIELEVSSPGLERKLIQPWHFSSVIGKAITFQYIPKTDDKKSFSGCLTQVNDRGITLDNNKYFDFEFIKGAHLVFHY